MSQWDFSGPPSGQGGEYDEYGEFVHSDDFEGGAFKPISYEREPYPVDTPGWPYDRRPDGEEPRNDTAPLRTRSREPGPPWAPQSPRASRPPRAPWPDESWPPRVPPRSRRPRWLIPGAVVAAVAAATGVGVVLLANGQPASHPSGAGSSASSTPRASTPRASAPAPASSGQPVTMARARQILAGYTTANNKANAAMSDTRLAAIETGSSYAIDAGIYRVQRAEKAAPYPAFGPEQTKLYIPREPAGVYPHWFVAQVVNAGLAAPRKAAGTEYLVFTQASPGAPWRNAIEPYVVSGGTTPQVALDADGQPMPVSADSTSLAIPPASIAQLTAASLDGAKQGPANPGNLADGLDTQFWHKKLPAARVIDRHRPGTGQVFGLQTTDGGALLFYTDAAELHLIPPAGEALHLTIPGFFSPGQARNAAVIGYMEQFATYVPPRGGAGLRVVADYSGITAR